MTELPKTFDPAAIEAKWYAHWESTGAFRPSRPEAEPYTIVMPPPNVTGSLHIGHALDNTLPDILIRHARMQGKDALWVVGTDHAGIATQMVVERQLNAQGQKRSDFTRDEFIAKVWEWKAESGSTITSQLRRLGASCDWANERFTMDEGFSKAVIKVFVDLYNEGLLYRDKRLVNWDPALKTAISDLEVETREVNGKFWLFKYPLEDGSGHISVATTRPETMLADMAVAVNPEDDRYKALVGKNVRLPITGRLIPIVADEHADPELGSGAVKITPGHDFNDFEVGKRAGFVAGRTDRTPPDAPIMLNMFNANADVIQTSDGLIPRDYLGLHRFRRDSVDGAREKVVAAIDAMGLLEKVEDRTIQTPYGDRSGVVIEPWLTDQWYVDAATLAKPAIEAVRSGAIEVVPKSWEKTYFNWMENIQPWCVSRQLWWGHRIPAWYGPDLDNGFLENGRWYGSFVTFVAENFEQAKLLAARHYSKPATDIFEEQPQAGFFGRSYDTWEWEKGRTAIFRDSDVLDTWFSSALWPFGTLGWPDQNPPPPGEGNHAKHGGGAQADSRDSLNLPLHQPLAGSPPLSGEDLLSRHYPNDILISGFDILFFWDARMIMQGLHFMKEVPWKTLYLHGLVRAADGSKMSKSKGNTVDPLGLIDQYGADALRFTLTAMESQGRDIKLDEKRVEGYRNFATKLWNAARFCQANGIGASNSVAAPKAELAVNRWIIGEVVETLAKLNQAIADLRFDAMADTIYHFAWGTFCDEYLELIKPVLSEKPSPLQGRGLGEGAVAITSGEPVDSPLSPALSPEGEREQKETRVVAGWVFDQILVMLHPFMPFITEELWGSMGERGENLLIHAKWPEPEAAVDVGAKAEIEWVIELVSEIRSIRTEMGIAPSLRLKLMVEIGSRMLDERHLRNQNVIERLARLSSIEVIGSSGIEASMHRGPRISDDYEMILVSRRGAAQFTAAGTTYVIPLEGTIDLTAERTRITNAITAISKERDALSGRLNNPAFVEKAKPEAVEKARADHAEKSAEVERLQAALARLG